jgi:hypothetical protein
MAERMARYLDLQPTEEIQPQRVALGQKRVALSRFSRD